ncbi:hypothetical protein AGR7A_pTi0043 [Agrobacterium deltaense NCPPB 1641]|uniref:Uncharacterized protein n=1 Tax=Agrobacterium deltaense NCPPB 1641 TaxID=1183425 RepID=A0A1S7UBN4_9HYPH|nr:hypothetical protein AGR7A_pTi0043 [Agrobacterium deltaense NCPPB 1641]
MPSNKLTKILKRRLQTIGYPYLLVLENCFATISQTL